MRIAARKIAPVLANIARGALFASRDPIIIGIQKPLVPYRHVIAETDPGCVFCRIAQREIASHVIYEDDLVFAFPDRGPIRPGHTQIIPKSHYDYFDGLPLSIATRMMEVGQKLAKVMKGLYGVPRVALVFTGGDVAHAHAHIVPMHEASDITSRRYIVEDRLTFRAPLPASEEELQEQARLLVASSQLAPLARKSES